MQQQNKFEEYNAYLFGNHQILSGESKVVKKSYAHSLIFREITSLSTNPLENISVMACSQDYTSTLGIFKDVRAILTIPGDK